MRRDAPSLPEPKRNFVFAPELRKFQGDFVFVDHRLIVELDGGIFSRKRMGHSTGAGIQRDIEKGRCAVMSGWRLLRYSSKDMKNPWRVVEEVVRAIRREE